MKRKKYLSYVFVPEGGGRTFRGRMSYPVLRIILGSLIIIILLFIFSTLQFGKISLQAINAKRAIEKVRALENELRKIEELEKEIAQLKESKNQIEGMLGVIHNPNSLGGKEKETSLPSIWPVKGQVTSEYSLEHPGMDIAVPEGSSVWATADGEVSLAGWDEDLGYLVEIEHGDGLRTVYGHNSQVLVEKGSLVKRGDMISFSGSSGRSTAPHLHYEIIKNGMSVDPRGYLTGN